MDNGFIMVPRCIERFAELEDGDVLAAYMKLRFLARFREGYTDGIHVGVNQLLISKPELADRLKFSVHKVRRILALFVKMGGITCENVKNKYTLITILPPFLVGPDKEKGGNGNPSPAVECIIDESVADTEEENTFFCERENKREAHPQKKKDGRGKLTAYGKFHNVYLTEEEYEELRGQFTDFNTAVQKFSASIVNRPQDADKNHYAMLYQKSLYEKENAERQMNSVRYGGAFAQANSYKPVSEASYDLKRAEERARSQPPKLKKRNW